MIKELLIILFIEKAFEGQNITDAECNLVCNAAKMALRALVIEDGVRLNLTKKNKLFLCIG